MRIYFGKGNGAGTKWQRAGHHDQARRLVEDHGFKTAKPEQADEQRQTKFSAPEADEAAQGTDDCARAERGGIVSHGHDGKNALVRETRLARNPSWRGASHLLTAGRGAEEQASLESWALQTYVQSASSGRRR